MTEAGGVARVLLETPLPQLDRLFDYRVPAQSAEGIRPGVRVKVPLRSSGRLIAGYVIEVAGREDPGYEGALSDLEALVSPVPVLEPEVWALARAVADRSAGSAADVVRLAVPPRQVRVEKAWLTQASEHAEGERTAAGEIHGYPSDRIERALDDGARLAVSAIPGPTRTSSGDWIGQWAMTMAAAAARVLAAGRSAILAVPDYRDQEQLEAACRQLVPAESICRVDARQPNPDRYRAFLRCLGGAARVIVGNRSAVYAPAARLGLIAVWDDGDPLHAEPLAPYAHTRDVALVRQSQSGCALIFLGNTRSVAVQRLVEVGWVEPVDPDPAVHPRVVVTARQETDADETRARIPSSAWREAKAGLADGPVLVQVATPGYAPALICQNCRRPARCRVCSGPLGLASARATPACRWCGALATDWACPECSGTRMRLAGAGSARTAEELGRAFPGARVIVADGEHPVLRVDGKPALIVATRGAEPIADGGYRTVLLLDGERMLARESLDAGADCLRWWSNAAALVAPGKPVVLVGVDGALATAMATWRQDAYASAELADRRALRFPPAVRTASVVGTAPAVEAAVSSLSGEPVIDVLGPAPLPNEQSRVRAIVRFDYAHGTAVAVALRASIIRAATSGRRRPVGKGGYRPPPTLKVRFDEPLDPLT